MMIKIFISLLLIFSCTGAYADVYTTDTGTTNYDLPFFTRGQQNWDNRMNLGIVSLDSIFSIMSTDIASLGGGDTSIKIQILSNDAVIQDNKLQILTNDSVIQDNKLTILSNDSAWTKSGTKVSLITSTNEVGIGTSSPTTELEVIGQISGDAIRFDIQTASPDTTTLKGPCLYVHSGGGIRYYTGSAWGDIGVTAVGVTSVAEGTSGPLVISPTTGAIIVSIASADTSTDGYIKQADWNTWTNDRVSQDTLNNYVSQDTIQNYVSKDATDTVRGAASFSSSNFLVTSPGAVTIKTGGVGATELDSTSVSAGSYMNTTLTVDGDGRITSASSGSSGGKIVQVVNVMDGAVDFGTTTMPFDDTIPQITEGDEYMTLAITPTSATNKLKIDVVLYGSISASINGACALFQGTTAGALAAVDFTPATANYIHPAVFTYYMTAGTTSATTFRVRAGGASASTFTFNGVSTARKYGGVMASSITITEITS